MSGNLKKNRREGERRGEGEVLNDLHKCQNDILALRQTCDRQIDEIERSYVENVRPFMEHRNVLIQNVPGFWTKSILGHPLLSTIFEPGEPEVLNYMTKLDVEEDTKNPDNFVIRFSFKKNPYFENRTLSKEFRGEGSSNSEVRWRKGQHFPKMEKHELWENDELGLEYKGFFRWFFDREEHFCDPIADILKTCIWYNPMEFYKRMDSGDVTTPSSDKALGRMEVECERSRA